MPTASQEATITLVTYYNYVSAWVVALEREYGRAQESVQAFWNKQRGLATFSRLQGGKRCSDELTSAYCRGKLTLMAMRGLPVHDYPDLAATANLWLPVQAYYAIHALGMAALTALGQTAPRDHRSFRTSFSQTICRLLPPPFCASCGNGPRLGHFTFTGIVTSPEEVAAQSNLSNPVYSEGDHFIGKSLSTTREKALLELFDKARHENIKPGCQRRNLKNEERQRVAQNLHSTSIADLLYRMRVRANYDDPEMYLAAFDDTKGTVTHYEALMRLLDFLDEGLCAIVRRKIGQQTMDKLEARLQ